MKIASRGHSWRAETLGWEDDVPLPIRRAGLIIFRFLKRNQKRSLKGFLKRNLKKGSSLGQTENCFSSLCEASNLTILLREKTLEERFQILRDKAIDKVPEKHKKK